jgi:hypothetical protein
MIGVQNAAPRRFLIIARAFAAKTEWLIGSGGAERL